MAKIVKPKAKAVAAKIKTAKTAKNPLVGTTWMEQNSTVGSRWCIKIHSSDTLMWSVYYNNGQTISNGRPSYTFKNNIFYFKSSGSDYSFKISGNTMKGGNVDSSIVVVLKKI